MRAAHKMNTIFTGNEISCLKLAVTRKEPEDAVAPYRTAIRSASGSLLPASRSARAASTASV
jgi:hypothetical protein